jgi:hypothetical protein
MDVDDRDAHIVDERTRQDLHVAREDDEVDVALQQPQVFGLGGRLVRTGRRDQEERDAEAADVRKCCSSAASEPTRRAAMCGTGVNPNRFTARAAASCMATSSFPSDVMLTLVPCGIPDRASASFSASFVVISREASSSGLAKADGVV